MALRTPFAFSIITAQTQKLHPHTFPSSTLVCDRPRTRISCTNSISDAEFASEVAKINSRAVQKEEAMKKSKELLFTELCQYLALKEEEVKKKWKKMDEEEKWGLVRGFVSEWSVNFHPLSSRSVKDMIEEYLQDENPSSAATSPSLFPELKKLMGFSQDK